MIIGLTGGIACGKTTTREKLLELNPMEFFDADKQAKEILVAPNIQSQLKTIFGPDAINDDLSQNIEFIRETAFSDPAIKIKLQELIHPEVITRCKSAIQTAQAEGRDLLLDVPLLFEVEMDKECDAVITVTCKETTQIKRLKARGIDSKLAKKIIASQMPQADKIARSQHIINNNASLGRLESQIRKVVKALKKGKKGT